MTDYMMLALIGHPLSHSLSPILHNAALQFAELKGEYRLIDIQPKNFQQDLAKLLPIELKGFNVTIPYKEDIYRLMSNHSTEAKLTGAVNTVKVEKDGSYSGHNTDLLGFKQSFADSFDINIKDKHALIIGAGGAAKAVVVGLAQMGIAKIQIKARDTNKVNAFIAEIKSNLARFNTNPNRMPEIVATDQNYLDNNNEPIATVINTSPIGLHGEAIPAWLDELLSRLPTNCVCFDLVYRKDKSKPIFAQTAVNKNLAAVDGLSMLIHQARFAFKYWTGVDVPAKIFSKSLGFEIKG
jgi:shikimate dehydrogenase